MATKPKSIALVYYCKTPKGWRRFPATFTKNYGADIVNPGVVVDHGKECTYPGGRYQLRRFIDGKQVFTNCVGKHPRDIMGEWQRALRSERTAAKERPDWNPLAKIDTAAQMYRNVLLQRDNAGSEKQARIMFDELLPILHRAGVKGPHNITSKHVLQYLNSLRERGCAPQTVLNRDDRLRAWLKFCKVTIDFDPQDRAKAPRKDDTETYTPAEIKGILDAAGRLTVKGVAFRLCLMLGLREQEMQHAEWPDVDFEQAVFTVQPKERKGYVFRVKSRKPRTIPVPQDFLQLLREWREKRPNGLLIVGAWRDAETERPLSLLRPLKRLARRAGLHCKVCDGCRSPKHECEGFYLHKFRASYATRMLQQSDPRTVMYLLGHSSLAVTLRYLAKATNETMQRHANAIDWTA